MKSIRISSVAGLVAGALAALTACGSAEPAPNAAPSAAPSAAPASAAPDSPAGSKPAGDTKSVGSGKVLGPDGFRGLRLGMTASQALATGALVAGSGRDLDSQCSSYQLKNGGKDDKVLVSRKLGLALIFPQDGVGTAEGLRQGDPAGKVRKLYPGATSADDIYLATPPGYPKNQYRISVDGGKVDGFNLGLEDQDCVG